MRALALLTLAVIALLGVGCVALVSMAEPEMLPTDKEGEGRTEELVEAMARHGLDLPAEASEVSYWVHSSIDSVDVAVRFRTTPDGVADFMTSPALQDAELCAR